MEQDETVPLEKFFARDDMARIQVRTENTVSTIDNVQEEIRL